ncbi:MAG TPA: OmpA family protein [Bacteroidia bacterium]|nr:OmpA family protein [Bacteroidia bacterium]
MKRKTIYYYLCMFLMFLSVSAMAQKNAIADADNAFKNMKYFDAIDMYKKAFTDGKVKKDQKAKVIFQVAECYRAIGDAKQEEQWYAKAIKAKYPDPKAILYMADAQKQEGNYDDAVTSYKQYMDQVPSDPRGADGVKSCELAGKWKNAPTRYVVTNMAQLNTKFEDFAPCYADRRYDELYFTSTRPGSGNDKIDPGLGQSYSDLFETKMDKNGKWSTPTPLPAPVNSDDNEGEATFDKSFKTMYFTRCGVLKNKGVHCKIYSAERKGTAWDQPVLLAFQTDTVTYGHPSLSADGETLFFASDLAGGYGGKDIWMSKYDKKTKSWGEPINLGADINTPGNEVFPFIHSDGTLYFSSDGHPGMGGLDIFKAQKTGTDKWGNVTNMMAPINSEGDDFGIIFEGTKERGYFSSNRQNGKGSDDIYSFNLPPILYVITGTVRDKDTKKPVKSAIVRMVGSDGTDVALLTDTGGHYTFGANGGSRYISGNTSYILNADGSKVEYLASDVKANVTTVGVSESKTWIEDFELQHASVDVAIRFPKVQYALDKADLTGDSKDSLNFLVKLLNNNPTIIIELDAHTDQQGSVGHNKPLSQARAQSCVNYLISQGIDSARLKAKGWWFSKPLIKTEVIAKMKTKQEKDAAYAINRRTEFRVLSFNYVPKGYKMSHLDSVRMQHMHVSGQGQDYGSDTTDINNQQDQPAPGNAPAPAPQGNQPKAPAPNNGTGTNPKKN